MTPLSVRGLEKRYPGFTLENVCFDLTPGRITGFIGRNGAGKTTTLRCVLDLAHPDGGEVLFWGRHLDRRGKARIGYVSGGVRFYPRKTLSTITGVTRRFYESWDEAAYRRVMAQYGLDEARTPAELSEGMKVKYALALALSHGAELLILDEPTSGLDPVSRDELLDLLLDIQRQGATILFSTHITSDLERCADEILYIRNGHLAASAAIEDFAGGYRLLRLPEPPADLTGLIGPRQDKRGFTALVPAERAAGLPTEAADLETIMVHLEREAEI